MGSEQRLTRVCKQGGRRKCYGMGLGGGLAAARERDNKLGDWEARRARGGAGK